MGTTDWEELRWRAEENLREAFRLMARNATDGAVLEVDNACFIATGIPNAFFNPVFLYRPPDDVENFFNRVRAFYEMRGGLPWTLIVIQYEYGIPMLVPEQLRDVGLVTAGHVPMLMRGTQRDPAWPRFHPNLMIERVGNSGTLADHRETLAASFGLPGYVADMLMSDVPPPTMRLYVAYQGGDPVATVSLFEAAGVGGLYNLGTAPAFRRSGIATAMVRHALEEACWEAGLTECVTQVPRAILPLFRDLGFERLGSCARFVEPRHLPPEESKRRTV